MTNLSDPEGLSSEWKAHWPLLLAATLGMSLQGVHLYSLGVLLAPIHEETGWSRTEITFAQTISAGMGIITAPIGGWLMDRFGARRVGFPCAVLFCASVTALSLTGSSIAAWYAMWVVLSLTLVGMKPNVWTGAVSGVFVRSRALSFAIVISGVTLASAIVPSITNQFVLHSGWRSAYLGLGTIWALVVLPVLWLFLRPPQRAPAAGSQGKTSAKVPVKRHLLSSTFLKLALAGFLFSLVLVSVTFHFVPILSDRGIDTTAAAAIAGVIGICSVIGRLLTGVLLDRFAGHIVGGIALLLPILPLALLLTFTGDDLVALTFLAIILGLALGAELDLLSYLTSRHFGLESYGTVFGFLVSFLAAATALGPVLAAFVRDSTGSYNPVLQMSIPIVAICSFAIFSIGKYPSNASPH